MRSVWKTVIGVHGLRKVFVHLWENRLGRERCSDLDRNVTFQASCVYNVYQHSKFYMKRAFLLLC